MVSPNKPQTALELLADRQNVGLAWEVWKTFPRVIEQLQVKFWCTLERLIRPKVAGLAGWQLSALPKKDTDLLERYFQLLLLPQYIKDSQLSCRFALEQDRQAKPFLRYDLYFGIHWSQENAHPTKSREYEALKAKLEESDFSKNSWWIGRKYLDFKIGDDPQILEQLVSGDTLEEEVASDFVTFVTHYAKDVERLNKALWTAK